MAQKKKRSSRGGPNEPGPFQTGMLSYARSVQVSEGLFWGTRSGDSETRDPIEVLEKGVRGQSSEAKTDKPGKSNPQVVEAATVPPGCDGVELRFTLTVFPFSRKPWACGDAQVTKAYVELVDAYAERGGFGVLALLYCWNVANARFAWRNRYQSDATSVIVEFDGKRIAFDPSRLDLEKPPSSSDELERAVTEVEASDGIERATVTDMVEWVRDGLERERRFLRVTWKAAMNEAEEVFPSQEFLRDEIAKDRNTPSRVYAKLPRFHHGRALQQAAMHSQKIGAALRHIDVWHGRAAPSVVAVNPYGGVQETGDVLRDKQSNRSFYALRADAETLRSGLRDAKGPDELPADAHFVIANLVRGGVFGEKGDG